MDFEQSEEQKLILGVVDEACKKIRPIEDRCYLEHRFNDQVLPVFKDAHPPPLSGIRRPKPVAILPQGTGGVNVKGVSTGWQ